jgi:hypothetical protein
LEIPEQKEQAKLAVEPEQRAEQVGLEEQGTQGKPVAQVLRQERHVLLT